MASFHFLLIGVYSDGAEIYVPLDAHQQPLVLHTLNEHGFAMWLLSSALPTVNYSRWAQIGMVVPAFVKHIMYRYAFCMDDRRRQHIHHIAAAGDIHEAGRIPMCLRSAYGSCAISFKNPLHWKRQVVDGEAKELILCDGQALEQLGRL